MILEELQLGFTRLPFLTSSYFQRLRVMILLDLVKSLHYTGFSIVYMYDIEHDDQINKRVPSNDP